MIKNPESKTEELLLVDLPKVFNGSSTDRWEAVREMRIKADELAASGDIDDRAMREIAIYNAGRNDLDFFGADQVFDAIKKPAGGSLGAMRAPSQRVWVGTGSCITTTNNGEIVHYVNRPGEVERRYGPALPYILDKLAWLAIARDIKGHHQVHSGDGYRYVANRLNRIGRKGARPHIGSIAVYTPENLIHDGSHQKVLLSSASGTLPTAFHDYMYEHFYPSLKDRTNADREAGLFDNYEGNKRAGIYDIAFAEMVGLALLRDQINDRCLSIFDIPRCFDDVDIN